MKKFLKTRARFTALNLMFGSVLAIAVSQPAFAGDLMNHESSDGQKCSEVVESVVSTYLKEEVRAVSFNNLTPGSYYQKYVAVVEGQEYVYSVLLTGEFDCDRLKVQKAISISPLP